jgi:hypothetical protein
MPSLSILQPMRFFLQLIITLALSAFLGALGFQGTQVLAKSRPAFEAWHLSTGIYIVYTVLSAIMAIIICGIVGKYLNAVPKWFEVIVHISLWLLVTIALVYCMFLINNRVANDFIGFYKLIMDGVSLILGDVPKWWQ